MLPQNLLSQPTIAECHVSRDRLIVDDDGSRPPLSLKEEVSTQFFNESRFLPTLTGVAMPTLHLIALVEDLSFNGRG